jgi:hypothetical protein
MNLCTKLVRRWKYAELVPATAKAPARWGRTYFFEHCGRPAVGSHEATHWCARHGAPKEKADG